MTGGYFNKLLQFRELSCTALASLVTTNGACVAGCGPGKGEVQGAAPCLGVLLPPGAVGPGTEGVAVPGHRVLPQRCLWHGHFLSCFFFCS